ncbi:MAG: replication factor C small subunit [Aigarchaeota archaeon]|nr:replication factor C small subunit [Aigarchaeota archaeon]MDW8092361.1 replication factor C small subunit [Nitrososphaerota archaeon]
MDVNESMPWVEKYRPKTLDEVIDQEEVVKSLRTVLRTKVMPHMLFAGPPGVGKTATAHAFARDLFGPEYIDVGLFMEINASDERGIDTIREKVKNFARTIPLGGVGFKILLLDESDQLTDEAQHAFRRVMEQFSSTCRFILAANYSSRIIEPIQSRCTVFRFRPIDERHVVEALKRISARENLSINEGATNAIVNLSEGDLRRAINLLQVSATLSSKIDEEVVYRVAGVARAADVRRLLELAVAGRLVEARDALRNVLYVNGVSERELLVQIYREVFYLSIPEEKKLKAVSLLGEIDYRISQGATPEVQLVTFLSHLASYASEGKGR